MGDRMTPIPFGKLMNWILTEKEQLHKVFGVREPFKASMEEMHSMEKGLTIFGEKIETPFGPAAGPHTQLAQNIIAAYYTGSRFFELKTVQILDGEDLPVAKPCILAEDEGYNCEWSTELRVADAFQEYVKAWIALKVIAKEFDLGDANGFVFNMSVGYDLKGIQSEKIDTFIENMKDAKDTAVFKESIQWLKEHIDSFSKVTLADIEKISSRIGTSVTVSTLHGCPPQEIESIAAYLMKEKKLNTFIKCNPTLLGYEAARKIMDDMGYDYVIFGDFHFKDDLQFEDAVPMLERLQTLSEQEDLCFGVKITNTFPVDVTRNELPSEEMYMSGKALCALSLSVAHKLSEAFQGQLRISYSGGADYFNIDRIYKLGIWPVTIATTLLKPGGYQRCVQIGKKLAELDYRSFTGVQTDKLKELIEEIKKDRHHKKALKPLPSRKMTEKVPLFDCFTAPCSKGCPIHQDIPAYMKMVADGNDTRALEVILDKNPLPFITGTICNHLCMSQCTRNFYETPIEIRAVKLIAAQRAYEAVLAALGRNGREAFPENPGKKVAVVGGGPAGIAAAYFLARAGARVTVFEKKEAIGGVVRHVIPEFRIGSTEIDKDISLAEKMGAEFITNHPVTELDSLTEAGFEAIFLAIGAGKSIPLGIPTEKELNAIQFLETAKKNPDELALGEHVVVIGAGNTAMDAARAAKRMKGVKDVTIVYRRTRRYMPADEEEFTLAVKDGVSFMELLAPVEQKASRLLCKRMKLGEMDASKRQAPVETEETILLPADTVIASLGEQVDTGFYQSLGLMVTEKGNVKLNEQTMEAEKAGVYVIGDGAKGPATVVMAIRDAALAVNHLLNLPERPPIFEEIDIDRNAAKKGILVLCTDAEKEESRCLSCDHLCENCVDVCPNRANVAINIKDKLPAIVHVDYMCNECGNCKSFCPYDSAPYLEKFTLFANEKDFDNSGNEGFVFLDRAAMKVKVRLSHCVTEERINSSDCELDENIRKVIQTINDDYSFYLI